jgi:hypothetical protein
VIIGFPKTRYKRLHFLKLNAKPTEDGPFLTAFLARNTLSIYA